MSFLSELFGSITGSSNSDSNTVDDRPCANCPSDCAIAGDACSVCEPYKKKLIDAVYYVNNLTEYYDKYEVTGTDGTSAETVTCPYCGGQSSNLRVCEYCGSKLSDTAGAGKIRVANASDIPNPIMQAQDIIYERADAVIAKYSDQSSSDGILSKLAAFLTGSTSDNDDAELGAKMSEAEIKEVAGLYGVSIGDYLTGLDNGKYLTLKAYKEAQSGDGVSSYAPAAVGAAGLAGVGLLASNLFKKKNQTEPPKPPTDEMRGHQPPQNRPIGDVRNMNQMPPNNAGRQAHGMNGRPAGEGHAPQRGGSPGGGGPQRGGRGGHMPR